MSKTLKLRIVFTVMVCLASGSLSSGCRLFSKGKLQSKEGPNYAEIQEAELKRLAAAFAGIEEMFPQPEFKEIANQIFARFDGIYRSPEDNLRKPALIFILNSLPGTGKNRFVNEVVKALQIGNKENYQAALIKPTDYYLDFLKLRDLAESPSAFKNLASGDRIQPGVMLFDEYTLATTLEGTDKGTVGEAIRALRARVANPELQNAYTDLQEIYGTLRTIAEEDDGDGQVAKRLREIDTILTPQIKKLADLYNAVQRDLKNAEDKSSKVDFEDLKKKSDESFELLWKALGDGTLPAKGLSSQSSYDSALSNVAGQVGVFRKNIALYRAKMAVVTYSRQESNRQLQERQRAKDEVRKVSEPKTTYGPPKEEEKDAVYENLRDAIEKADKEIKGWSRFISSADEDIDTAIGNIDNVFKEIIATYGNEVIVQAAATLNIDPQASIDKDFEAAINQFIREQGLGEVLQEVRQNIVIEEGNWKEAANTIEPEQKLKGLFREQPQKFLDFYRNDLLKRSSDTERYTGNIVIFLAGNVLKFQRDVTSAVTEKGANECAQMTRDSNVPFYRNPDCLVYFTKKLLKDTNAMQEMEGAIGMVLGKKIYDELGQSKHGGDSNSLALRSRLGPIRFISPPDSLVFRKFLQEDLARLAQSFKSETGVEIIFDPSVVNDFLFPSYVNALLGFRNLIDRGTNHFSLLFNTRIKSIVHLFNSRQADSDCDKEVNTASVQRELKILDPQAATSVPNAPVQKVIVRFVKGDQVATGRMTYSGVHNGTEHSWFGKDEKSLLEEPVTKKELSSAERLVYSQYIGALYGSLGVMLKTIPTGPIPLAYSVKGVPLAAERTIPYGYDMEEMRVFLQLFSIEIQAYIAAIAGFGAQGALTVFPEELDHRMEHIKLLIAVLWDNLHATAAAQKRTREELLGRDLSGDVTGPPLSESDPLFSQLLKIPQKPRGTGLTSAELDNVFINVRNHFDKVFVDYPVYVDVMKAIAETVRQKLEVVSASQGGMAEIEPEVIRKLLTEVAMVDLSTKPGSPGYDICPLYQKQFGVVRIPAETGVSPKAVQRGTALFGNLAALWTRGWNRQNDALRWIIGQKQEP